MVQRSYLLARANEAVLEAQCLRMKGRVLRREAAIRASELGETVLRSVAVVGKRREVNDQQVLASN